MIHILPKPPPPPTRHLEEDFSYKVAGDVRRRLCDSDAGQLAESQAEKLGGRPPKGKEKLNPKMLV